MSLPVSAVPLEMAHAWLLRFEDLGTRRLYDVLRLRAEVFVVEQRCAYLDPDGQDESALHLGLETTDALVAYARLFPPTQGYAARFGRVLTAPSARGLGLGDVVVKSAIAALESLAPGTDIDISAQAHLAPWYRRHGFVECGEVYDEDGIPHIGMTRRTLAANNLEHQ